MAKHREPTLHLRQLFCDRTRVVYRRRRSGSWVRRKTPQSDSVFHRVLKVFEWVEPSFRHHPMADFQGDRRRWLRQTDSNNV